MGKTLREIVYTLKEELSGYNITDDTEYSDDYLISKINSVRSILLSEYYRENGVIHDDFYQKLCCLEVKCYDETCKDFGIDYSYGNGLFYVDIPPLVDKVGDKNIKYFGLSNFMGKFNRVTIDNFVYSDYNMYSSKKPVYVVIGDRIFLKNISTDGLKYVCLVGLLYNPLDSCEYSDEDIYPVNDYYKLELIVKKDILSTYSIVPDFVNDAVPGKAFIGNNRRQSNNSGGNENDVTEKD